MLPDRACDWARVLYMALIAGALGLVGQTWAQAHLPPTRTAIMMSMEPVFAAFFAVLLGGESLTVRMLVGGAHGAGRDAGRRARTRAAGSRARSSTSTV